VSSSGINREKKLARLELFAKFHKNLNSILPKNGKAGRWMIRQNPGDEMVS